MESIIMRRFTDGDSVKGLTTFLHRAYADHAAAGLVFFASYQTPEDTRRRACSDTSTGSEPRNSPPRSPAQVRGCEEQVNQLVHTEIGMPTNARSWVKSV
ncbi:hypothetical protein AB0B56_37015 [Streptosporangium canum]|uniref:hypothetical protein n=1 Tax=Streptosporangium canum TaxID=324952 RepID=UPI003412FB36